MEEDTVDDVSNHHSRANTSAGQGSEENLSTVEDDITSPPNSPFRSRTRITRILSFAMKKA